MADKDSRGGTDEKHLPRHEDLPDEQFGKVKFKSESFVRYLLSAHPSVEDFYMAVFKRMEH